MTEASRVQKLLTEQTTEIDRLKNRIEKLEAALRDLSDGWECCPVSQAMRRVARKALEDKPVSDSDARIVINKARKALEGKTSMSNDLVAQLREYGSCGMVFEAADRIKKLETALREIAEANSVQAGPDKDMYRRWRRVATNAIDIARNALEGKDD